MEKNIKKVQMISKKIFNLILSVIALAFQYTRKNLGTFPKRFPRVCAGFLALIVIVTVGITALVMTGATVAYEVRYNGNVIGCVSEPTVISSAEELANKMVYNQNETNVLKNVQYSSVVTGSSRIVQANELALAILNNSKGLKKSAVIMIDGNVVAYQPTRNEMDTIVSNYLKTMAENTGAESAKLCDNVSVKDAYYPVSLLSSVGTLSNLLDTNPTALPVKTIVTKTQTEVIPYQTVETKNDQFAIGTKKVTEKGIDGSAEVTVAVSYINGIEADKQVVATKIVIPPVNEQITIGDKQITESKSQTASAKISTSFIWPIEKVSGSYVSAYYGDGRGHKGLDIAAKSGTNIYAAENGTVTFAGWDPSGFGNCVIIDHGNGMQTLYAHCSQINVKVGDVVGQGETIAQVGCTGSATGNHLHFEVHINGARVNPAPYIGA